MEILGHFQTNVRRALREIDPEYESLPGLVICGSHAPQELDTEAMIGRIEYAREHDFPFLGICFGHQLAAIEYARHILNIPDATSEEFGQGTFVVQKRPQIKVGLHEGESYWSNYVVNIPFLNPEHFITTAYHPEYQSRLGRPHPVLVKFINLCKKS